MLCINNIYTDPYFNLATEEYLLKNFSEDIFMLWQNEPSVIIGKYQNVLAEVNLDFVEKKQIKIVRRLTGGGSVFHDLGNINLTFIERNTNADFDRFTARTVDLLSKLGIQAQADNRRTINVNGLKISGSAQCVHKDKVMYHATLLFSSDLKTLTATLDSDPKQVENNKDSKIYVQSVKSPVTNILENLAEPMDLSYLKDFVFDYFLHEKEGNGMYKINEEDIRAINILRDKKYATMEWNFHGKTEKRIPEPFPIPANI